jgi:outer membrane receptor protein involved in Fe transport
VKGENSGPAVSTASAGGIDGDPNTLYDNNASVYGPLIDYSKTLNLFNYTAAVSHKFSEQSFIYVRYSSGKKAPDLGFYHGLNTQTLVDLSVPQAEQVQQLEAGFRTTSDHYSYSVSPFYSKLSKVPQAAIFFDLAGNAYTEPTLFSGIDTLGVEIEGSLHPVRWFNFHTAVTLQNPQSKNFSFWVQAPAQSVATDTIVTVPDGQAENNPKLLANTTFTVMPTQDLSFDLVWRYTGARAANRNVAFFLPAFSQFDLNVSFAATKQLSFSLNVNNLLNDKGVMSWAKAGSFLASLDRQSLTKAQVAANPNDTFSIVTIQPRAAFLSVDYKLN